MTNNTEKQAWRKNAAEKTRDIGAHEVSFFKAILTATSTFISISLLSQLQEANEAVDFALESWQFYELPGPNQMKSFVPSIADATRNLPHTGSLMSDHYQEELRQALGNQHTSKINATLGCVGAAIAWGTNLTSRFRGRTIPISTAVLPKIAGLIEPNQDVQEA